MSKCKLLFDMSDSDDNQKLERMMKADDLCNVIWGYLRNSRKRIEQQIENSEVDAFEAVDICFDRFGELLEEGNIDIDKLWS